MGNPTFSTLTEGERGWITQQLAAARKFVATMSPADAHQPLTLEALDRAFAAWMPRAANDTVQVNAAINAVGIQFGQFLVDGAEFEWIIATDNCGTDLAIRALPGRGDVLVYPANFVAKRWERRESNFLAVCFKAICNDVATAAARWSREKRWPWWQFWQ